MLSREEYYVYIYENLIEKNKELFADCDETMLFKLPIPEGLLDDLFLLLDEIQKKYEFNMQTMCVLNYNQFVLWQKSYYNEYHYDDMTIAIKFMVFCCLADKILDSKRFSEVEKEDVYKKLNIQAFFSDRKYESNSFVEIDSLLNDIRIFLGSERVKNSPYYEIIIEKIKRASNSEIYMSRYPLLSVEMMKPDDKLLLVDKSVEFEMIAFLIASISNISDKMMLSAECIGKIFWMIDDICDFVDDIKNGRRNSILFYCTQNRKMKLSERVDEAFKNIDIFINELINQLLTLKGIVSREMFAYVLDEVWEWCSDIRKFAEGYTQKKSSSK